MFFIDKSIDALCPKYSNYCITTCRCVTFILHSSYYCLVDIFSMLNGLPKKKVRMKKEKNECTFASCV